MKKDIAIIIPAYNPSYMLKEILEILKKNEYEKIVVVNDGSINEEIFKEIEKQVILLKHEKNLGKGNALKTGFEYCLKNMENLKGVITVDADGQHLIQDINNIYEKFLKNLDCLVLGSRDFDKENIPLRSLIGNKIIRYIFKKKTKIAINDTQTGLRAIPFRFLEDFNEIKGERFEYEINMLLYATKNKIGILEQPIETIYINENKMSNFRTLKDSLKIISRLIKSK